MWGSSGFCQLSGGMAHSFGRQGKEEMRESEICETRERTNERSSGRVGKNEKEKDGRRERKKARGRRKRNS